MKARVLDFQPELEKVIDKSIVCHVSMVGEDGMPYVLPMNFAYADKVIYLHSAPNGKKIDHVLNNPNVCIAFSSDYELKYVNEEVACSYSMKYKSVLAYGKVEFVEEDIEEKKKITNLVMKKYVGRDDFKYSMPAIKNVKIWKIPVERFEGRAYGM
jgi:nitroimidazol reductase NimA-like FMN-containing flavoprotein (pyridoxamine 5'-phosphate oxidase superfamily)